MSAWGKSKKKIEMPSIFKGKSVPVHATEAHGKVEMEILSIFAATLYTV
jgi:hypothetical protein